MAISGGSGGGFILYRRLNWEVQEEGEANQFSLYNNIQQFESINNTLIPLIDYLCDSGHINNYYMLQNGA